jgi:GNAT superfamily N-acetyltransferase
MPDALIRRTEHADLAAIVQLRREWIQEQDGDIADPDFEENLAPWYAQESSRRIMWLAEDGGRPVGMMNLAIYERMPRPGRALSRWGYLGNVFVLAAYRNRGIGGQLVSAALNYADENDFVRVVLSPTERSIPLYERAGFGPADALMLRTPPQAPTDSASRSTAAAPLPVRSTSGSNASS